MIPNGSTPIKNEILTEIIFKGKLNLVEIKIIAYIIRWSWGFNGVEKRQDWTKKLTKRRIAKEGGMKESLVIKNINKMIAEKKIFIKNNCYQFNEHYEEWKNITNSYTKNNKKNITNSYTNITNSYTKHNKKLCSTDLKPLQDKPLLDRKETLKETIKEKGKKEKKISFNFKINLFNNLTIEQMEEYEKKYPDIDVYEEEKKMTDWLISEKVKKDNGQSNKIPKDFSRFINNWLRRCN